MATVQPIRMPAPEAASRGDMAGIAEQIYIARQFPRDVKKAMEQVRGLACMTLEIAQQCIYAVPRDGKAIEGPSIRLAEIVLSQWGNCLAGARIIDETDTEIVAQGAFHDLERNTKVVFEVRRRITGKSGRFSADMIATTANAARSIALRQAVFQAIPRALWWDIYLECRKVVAGDAKALANRREAALKAFLPYGVTPERVCAALGVRSEVEIGVDHLVTLRGFLMAIRDGETTPEEAFPVTGPRASGPAAPQAPVETPQPEDPALKESLTTEPAAVDESAPPADPVAESEEDEPQWDDSVPVRARQSWDDAARGAIDAFDAADSAETIDAAQTQWATVRKRMEEGAAGKRGKWLAREISAAKIAAIKRLTGDPEEAVDSGNPGEVG